jgi:predicted nuclease of predicted toxin-antitoxin system
LLSTLLLMKKILLDENLPEQLVPLLKTDFNIRSVNEMGWNSLVNGELLKAMLADGFGILLTADKNLPFQQNLNKYPLQVVVIRSFDNRFKTIFPFVEQIRKELFSLTSDEKVKVIDLRK